MSWMLNLGRIPVDEEDRHWYQGDYIIKRYVEFWFLGFQIELTDDGQYMLMVDNRKNTPAIDPIIWKYCKEHDIEPESELSWEGTMYWCDRIAPLVQFILEFISYISQ